MGSSPLLRFSPNLSIYLPIYLAIYLPTYHFFVSHARAPAKPPFPLYIRFVTRNYELTLQLRLVLAQLPFLSHPTHVSRVYEASRLPRGTREVMIMPEEDSTHAAHVLGEIDEQ